MYKQEICALKLITIKCSKIKISYLHQLINKLSKLPFFSYYPPLPLDVTNLKKPPEKKDCSVFGADRHKTAIHCAFSTRLCTKQQCTIHFPHVYNQNSSALYIIHTFIHKTAVHCTFSTRLYTKQQCTVHFPHVYTQNHNTVLIFLVHAGRKHKHVPQLHQTEKTDRNFGLKTPHLCRNVFHSV